MKLKSLLWIIIIVLILFIITYVFYLKTKKENNPPEVKVKEIKDIKNLYYTYSVGYSIDAYYIYDIKCEDKCTIKIKPNGYPEEEAKTYDLDQDSLNKIIEVLNKYEVRKWDGFNKSNKNVLDGDSFSFSITMMDGDSISASGYMMWPEHYRDVREELGEIFNSFIKEGDFKDK